jgi:hypothetical protein
VGFCCAVFRLRLATGASLYTQDDNIILERALEGFAWSTCVLRSQSFVCDNRRVTKMRERALGVSALNALAQAIKAALHASESV